MAKMTEYEKDRRYGPVVAEVGSKSEPNKPPYKVRKLGSVLTCNCNGWIFNKDKPKRCRHTDAFTIDELKKGQQVLRETWSEKSKELASGNGKATDLALLVVERMKVVVGLVLTKQQMELMAGVLRPHLTLAPASALTTGNDTIIGGVRRIILED